MIPTEPVRPLEALIDKLFGNLVGIDGLLRNAYVVAEAECALRLAGSIELTADALGALTKINKLLQAAVPPAPTAAKSPDDVMDVYVPGNWTCPKCGFVLSSQTLFMGSGEIGCTRDQVMAMSGELCPNDGEPMHRTTWHERAEDNRKWGESLMEDIIAATHAEHLPGALETARQNHRDIHAYRGALGYAVPGWHDGKLSDGTEPRCGMCDARSQAALPERVSEGKEHDLKTWPDYFQAIADGAKTFEIRIDDRGFKVGDVLLLREWDHKRFVYTGRSLRRRVTHVLRDFGLEVDCVCMVLEPAARPAVEPREEPR
jgi:hypothetical protein